MKMEDVRIKINEKKDLFARGALREEILWITGAQLGKLVQDGTLKVGQANIYDRNRGHKTVPLYYVEQPEK